jgi:hypothetical protein
MRPEADPASAAAQARLQAHLRDENDMGTMSHFTLRRFYWTLNWSGNRRVPDS